MGVGFSASAPESGPGMRYEDERRATCRIPPRARGVEASSSLPSESPRRQRSSLVLLRLAALSHCPHCSSANSFFPVQQPTKTCSDVHDVHSTFSGRRRSLRGN
jgi:hypothetical protein